MKCYRPIPIEQFFKDNPDLLKMWNVLEIEEEKSPPWYADQPMATSKKVKLNGIHRRNFNPMSNREHLYLVAKVVGVKELPIDMDQAFKEVLRVIDGGKPTDYFKDDKEMKVVK